MGTVVFRIGSDSLWNRNVQQNVDLLIELKLKYDRIKHYLEILNDTFIIEAKAKQLHY